MWSPRAVGVASLVAAAVHGMLAPAHFVQFWAYGLVFASAGAGQAILGLAILAGDVKGPSRVRMFLVGAAMNVALIALYAWTRLVGIPLVGPGAGVREGVGVLDLATVALEAFVVVGCVKLSRAKS